MTIIILYRQFVSEVFGYAHFMIGQIFQEGIFHKVIFRSKFADHYKSFSFLGNSAQCGIKHGVCEAIACRLEDFECILKLLCLQYALYIHQISMYCRMGKVFSVNCQCVSPIVKSSNDIHSGLLESKA